VIAFDQPPSPPGSGGPAVTFAATIDLVARLCPCGQSPWCRPANRRARTNAWRAAGGHIGRSWAFSSTALISAFIRTQAYTLALLTLGFASATAQEPGGAPIGVPKEWVDAMAARIPDKDRYPSLVLANTGKHHLPYFNFPLLSFFFRKSGKWFVKTAFGFSYRKLRSATLRRERFRGVGAPPQEIPLVRAICLFRTI
jgi:hypothetical protein